MGELGLALLGKCSHALLLVVRRKRRVKQSSLKGQPSGKRHLERLIDRILDHLHNGLGQVANLLSCLDSLIHNLVGGQHLADKSSALCFLGRQVDRPGQAHLHGLGLANGFDKTLRTTCTGNSAEFDLWLTKDGLVTCIDDVYVEMVRKTGQILFFFLFFLVV